jgi:hypothetical protein
MLKKLLYKIEWEALMWLTALIYLFLINPYEAQHLTFCPYKNIGIEFCPGCGIGKSISLLYHFDFINSFHTHPLGIFALVILVYRIFHLIKQKYFNKKREIVYG